MDRKIYVTKSSMPSYEEYTEAIKPLWDSHWLTNMGIYHQKLEHELEAYLNVSQISLMVNGHMALELAIQAMKFPEGAEIITTPFTFISTTHAILRNKLKPVFCDVKLEDGTIDENKIEQLISDKTVGIVPVHVYGNICEVEKIEQIARRNKLKVIYDAAHAFGEKYKDKAIGTFGDASVFSFHATKVFNTIEGGAVSCSDKKLYDKLYNLKNFGIRGEESVVEVGANAKLNEFSAIMGLCNLKNIDSVIKERKKRYLYYEKELNKINGIRILRQNVCNNNYGYLPILIEELYPITRDELYNKLKEYGVFTRKYFYPITCDQECFEGVYENLQLNNARKLSKQVLVLPLYEKEDIDMILKILQM